METPKIAIVILNWNGEKLLHEYLPQVIDATDLSLGKIIVADNGSTDGSIALLKEKFPTVETIIYDQNYGFAKGYNFAIERIKNRFPYVILLNSDVAPENGWLLPLYNYMEEHPRTGACQPKILSDKARDSFEYAGACGGFLDKHGYPYCRGRIFNTCEKDNGQYDSAIEIFWASGAALMIRSNVYIEAGGLDPEFFAHMEEIDLCWRIQLLGYAIAAVPESKVYHLGGGTLPASNPKKTYLNFRNNLLMMHKNLPDSSREHHLLVRRVLDAIAWAKFMGTGDFANGNAILRAHRDFAKMRKAYSSHPSRDIIKDGKNILVDYYLRGKKTWSRLQ